MREYIPDPDVFMYYTSKFDQWLAADWFLNLLVRSLDGNEIHEGSFKNAVSRRDLVKCLRYRYSDDSALMDEPPPKVLLWANTRGEWPSLTKGGCRFLPQCRAWFLEMVRIWTREGLRWEIGVKLPTLTEDLKEYAVFRIAPSVI